MKKLFTTLLAVAMIACSAIPAFAADPAVPVAKSGEKNLTGVTANGDWSVTDDAVTSTGKDNNFVFTNDNMEAGKLTATIDRTAATEVGHDGIMFCISDSTTKFWEKEVSSYYFLFVEKGNEKLGLIKSGNGYNGWDSNVFKDRYVIPEEDRTGVYTISAEWDCSGTIKCYLNGELVMTHNDGNPLPGTRYGLRAASVGASYSDIVAAPTAPAENAIRNCKADAIPGTITVDGVIDEAWADAPVYTMENVVTLDSTGDAATRKDSSTIKFRMMYNETKVYMLFEIVDDVFIVGQSDTNWKNDTMFIYISEDGVDRSRTSNKSTQMCAFLENYSDANSGKSGLIVRSGKGANDNPKEHAVKIDGNKAVMEISFQFNTITPVEGGSFVLDLQYNDQDKTPDGNNTRTIVWAWSTSHSDGPDKVQVGSIGWGDVRFVAAPVCEHTGGEATCTKQAVCTKCGESYGEVDADKHGETEVKNAKEATKEEEGYTGDKVCKDCGKTVEAGTSIPKLPATNEPTTPPATVEPAPTGDATLVVAMLALVAVAGAVVITRRRKVTE